MVGHSYFEEGYGRHCGYMSLGTSMVDLKTPTLHANASGRPMMSVASASAVSASTASHHLLRAKIDAPKSYGQRIMTISGIIKTRDILAAIGVPANRCTTDVFHFTKWLTQPRAGSG